MSKVVIVGIGEVVEQVPEDLQSAASPLDLMHKAALAAVADCGGANVVEALDSIAVVRTFSDSGAPLKSPFGDPDNPPRAVAARIGATPKLAVYSPSGGQAPQQLVNEFAAKISQGDCAAVLLVGAEALANQKALKKAGVAADWSDSTDGPLDERPADITGTIDINQFHNEFLNIPAIYTLLENARRRKLGLSREDYADSCAGLFEGFSQIAANHPCAMFPQAFTAQDIATVSGTNNAITDTYSRAMTAKDGVNQGAAVILMCEDKAIGLGLDPSTFIYPIAGSEAQELTLPYREDLGGSVAMTAAYDAAFEAAGMRIDDVTCMDLYSCFPIAVFTACEALGIETNDPRKLTVTGGLPFFGGAGNNYSMHAIVNVVKTLRADGKGLGLVGANGGFISKHCIGLYAAAPPAAGWREADQAALAAKVMAQSSPEVALHADGRARIESYGVEFGRTGPLRGFIVGRLEDGRRFVGATDRKDEKTVQELLAEDPLGREVYVTSKGPGNRFTFAPEQTRALIPKVPDSFEGDFEHCLVMRNGPVLEITINRPESRNSLTPEANFELERIFDLYESDRSLWVAILTGAGDQAFSAGNDLKYMATGNPIWVPETGFAGLTHRTNRSKPVLAAVNGFAFGGGLEIALACDLIIADESASFALPEVKTGLIAAAGGLFRLPQALPPHIAKEMILTGRAMDVEEAMQHGLVNHKAAKGQALDKAREMAAQICAVSPTAVSASLEMMQEGADTPDPAVALARPTKALTKVAASEDLQIGLLAFLAKQAAKWKNK